MADHPLVAWLKRKKLKPYRFADAIKMPRRTLYSHLSGKLLNPSLKAMRAIEKGTDGRVTIKAQSVWFAALALLQGVEDDPDDEAPDSPEPDEAEDVDEAVDDDADDPRDDVQP